MFLCVKGYAAVHVQGAGQAAVQGVGCVALQGAGYAAVQEAGFTAVQGAGQEKILVLFKYNPCLAQAFTGLSCRPEQ